MLPTQLGGSKDHDSKLSSISSPRLSVPLGVSRVSASARFLRCTSSVNLVATLFLNSSNLSNDCAVRRLFWLIVELRVSQRIERRLRHGLA